MLIEVPKLLTTEQVAACRIAIAKAKWIDGKGTAGDQSGQAKVNLQADEADPNARTAGEIILRALGTNPLFISAALPLHVFPPLFNSYADAQHFGDHVDNAIRQVPGTHHRIRTDLSATVFLTDPADYDGGELIVADTYGEHSVKLPAGHMILYPATSLHRVCPVTRGARVSSFFWIQSMVRDDSRRTLLFDLDTAIQRLRRDHSDHPSSVGTMSVYHNLVRMWAEV